MTKQNKVCVSCKRDISASEKSAEFKCPVCEEKVVRCGKCRKLMVKYTCECGFEGP
jgi:predicted RNA-binding Zn-ribbon protein involved in translation (DUF1610 family)